MITQHSPSVGEEAIPVASRLFVVVRPPQIGVVDLAGFQQSNRLP